MRFLNLCVLALLVAAAAYVYEIKFESTLARRARRQDARRHSARARRHRGAARRMERRWKIPPASRAWRGGICACGRPRPTQYDSLDRLPERPPAIVQPPATDAIADKIEDLNPVTGSVPALMGQR